MSKRDWDNFYLGMARYVSRKSKDPSTKCGAIIVRPDHTVCSLGFNGFPRDIEDDERLLQRDSKYSLMVHAEMNAILNTQERIAYYTLYTYPLPPCDRCAVHIIQSGIRNIVTKKLKKELRERWGESIDKSKKYFEEAGLNYIEY